MQLLVQQIWQGWEAAYWHVPRWYWKSWSSNHTLSCKVVVDASPVWGFLPSDFATVTVCFDIRWFWKYFRSHHAFRSWMEGAIIPLYFPLVVLIKYHDGWFSLFYFFWPVPLLCYVFLLISHCFRILSVFLSHSAMIFVVVPLLSLVLEILFACLGWLAAPTVFQVLPIFFFSLWKEHLHRVGDFSSRSLLLTWDVGKAVSFPDSSLWMECVCCTASWVCFSTRRHVGSSRGAEAQVEGGNKDILMMLALVPAPI